MKRPYISFLFSLIWLPCVCGNTINPEVDTRLNFRYLSVNDGLAQFSVQSILQNRNGVVMIGTYDGISFFDGYSIVSERRSDEYPDGLVNNRILFMTENREGNIWIGMDGALMLYETATGRYLDCSHALQGLISQRVRTILEDDLGELWIGTDQEVVRGRRAPDGTLSLFAVAGLESMNIYSIVEDMTGDKWIATSRGLFHCRSNGIILSVKRIEAFAGRNIYSLHYDRKGVLWIGREEELWNSADGETFNRIDFSCAVTDGIRSILCDGYGRIWLGTDKHGLYSLQLDEMNRIVSAENYNKNDFFGRLTNNTVSALYLDRSNVLWIGTHRGVNYADLTPPNIHTFKPSMEHVYNELGFSGKHIESLFIDSFGTLWMSVFGDGLYRYDFGSRRLEDLKYLLPAALTGRIFEPEPGSVWIAAQDGVYCLEVSESMVISKRRLSLTGISERDRNRNKLYLDLCRDRYGDLWIATPKGVARYFTDKGENVFYTKEHGLSSGSAYSLLSDPDNDVIWVGSSDRGISRIGYSPEGIEINVEVIRQEEYPNGLGSNQIWYLYRARDGVVWIGTDAGLSRMEERQGAFVSISKVDAPYLKNAKILAITEDLDGNLWLNSSQGLYHYDPRTGYVDRYFSEDGMQSNTWTHGAAISENGWIFVGGINGINYFNPAMFRANAYTGRPILTGLKVQNEYVIPGQPVDGRMILTENIDRAKNIELYYGHNNFTIEFSSDHYARSAKNRFRYKLQGYDNRWIEVGPSRRSASYAYLSAGTYTFLLESANNDGLWSETTHSLKITIRPPVWQTWWMRSLFVLLAVSVVIAAVLYVLSRQRWRHKLVAQKIEQRNEQEINRMKLDFFTNITHELRTPLVLIMAPLQDLLERSEWDEYARFRLEIIHKNTRKLLMLVNQILDIRKVSAQNLPIAVSRRNLEHAVREILHSFHYIGEQADIMMHFDAAGNFDDAWFDMDNIQQVLQNLISNAYKFTPGQGNIHTRLRIENRNGVRYANISVQDSGLGIAAEDRDKIFDRFFHGTPLTGYSSGVGLSLVKTLIEAHCGEIVVASSEGQGTTFTIAFPIDRNFYPEELWKMADPEVEANRDSISNEVPIIVGSDERLSETVTVKPKRHLVLIVEDCEDMQAYIRESLKEHFRIEVAVNGEEALALAQRLKPDVIISDIMMPVMDGIEMIRALKSNPRTNFIPVIVHSVQGDKPSVRKALTAGAQEYIIKPFEAENLVFRITNLLKSREHFAQKLKAERMTEPSEIDVPSGDEQLLRKIGMIVERNMHNPMFDIELLAVELGMSRMQLYRRMKRIAGGKTVSEIIREIRIKRAGQLLSTGQKRVSEVMFEVGINNHYRFIRYFQEFYGMIPRDYIRMHAREQKDPKTR